MAKLGTRCPEVVRRVELCSRALTSSYSLIHGEPTGDDDLRQQEGFMCRPVGDMLTRLGSRIICKVKTRELAGEEMSKWLNLA